MSSSHPRPIRLTDDQLTIITRIAEPLSPADRGPYLERVAELLRGVEIGDGVVTVAARTAAAMFWRPLVTRHPPQHLRRFREQSPK